ncbi:MAG: neutral/alkaline non-lysosomal ceramidase N-terminal domain-containing protein [Chitinophagaceae bacterium]|nr:neutral/alkaline non-lysosomal ceramidase N-terminal domain-containing protein [Chitinophagaceae bacterium]MCW5929081.1 neutral/alkaline non-lysosomal ceramidase N-terminal domain-containing protein [Chitinophagaceae bacterium]
MKRFVYILWLLLFGYDTPAQATDGWMGGVAKADITPTESMFLAGYASRTHESEGTLHKLWAKALVLQDAAGKRSVLITTDLLGMPKEMSDNIRQNLYTKFALTRAQVLINSSHTHTGPVLYNALFDIYDLDEHQLKKIRSYSEKLETTITNLVDKAIKNMQPVVLSSQNGVVRFQVNRRNNNERTLLSQEELKGPNDYAVPVIKVQNKKGRLLAIAFGYACHPTVLDSYQWSGDYPGFAQLALEKNHPGAIALFFQGAGADQNPLPRRSVPLAEQYGKELAAAVERVLREPMQLLSPTLRVAYKEVPVAFDHPLPDTALQKMAVNAQGYQQRWARRMLDIIKKKEPFPTGYPYPVQVWKLGEQAMVSLGGELVIQYAIDIKKKYGSNSFVLGYSNDVMSYIPSEKVLEEGGYEGAMAHWVYGLPAKWATGIQEQILTAVDELMAEVEKSTE